MQEVEATLSAAHDAHAAMGWRVIACAVGVRRSRVHTLQEQRILENGGYGHLNVSHSAPFLLFLMRSASKINCRNKGVTFQFAVPLFPKITCEVFLFFVLISIWIRC